MSTPPKAEPPAANGRNIRLINHMLQLQDFIFARDQQQLSMPGSRLSQLDASIQSMLADLPDEVRSHFEKMWKKAGLAIVPISKGVCSACGMMIPVSQVHAVHAADALYHCPSCARYLFFPEAPPRRVPAQKKLRSEPSPVGIARFSSPALMLPKLKAGSRDEVLEQICGAMERQNFVDNGQRLFEEAVRREVIASTAVDQGLAFPHVRGVEGGGLTLALGILPKGVKFSEGSRALTRIVFFMSIPTAASAFYLKLLSGLTKTFREDAARDLLINAETSEELWKALVKTTRLTIT
ncbi:MAG TPA: PTS sugar transporter subunit IIA [Kiritimatiellia bacterium]|nr:PTS sugar transporter subunit IIA [Kiritimatiellia bacterium]HMP00261.1 PTS sugar transporter subunit IIA [Kiritimatiellia bacterium]HMP97511.1 PTS sugar transporter subunit IIA [Kiritimatiellia bacterium]